MTGFGEDGLEVDGGSVKDILDITGEFWTFSLQFYDLVHLETEIIKAKL